MNNNRGNNRRRGRGGNRQNGGGGGQQLNRIDSRARGNAPQLLEKYRKLAHDSHLNGDRVQEEYYLQFADHYFRVLADTRQRQDEQRVQRQDRWQDGGDGYREDGEAGEMGAEGDYGSYDSAPAPRNDRQATDDEGYGAGGEERGPAGGHDGGENPFVRESRPARNQRPRRDEPRDDRRPQRDDRAQREDRPQREDRRPRRDETRDNRRDERPEEAPAGLDPSMLPPAISASRPVDEETTVAAEEAKPRRRVTRKPKPPVDDAGEALEAVG